VKGLLYYCLGETNSIKGNQEEAKDAYMKSVNIFKGLSESKPDYYYAHWGLASSYYGLKQYGYAIPAYKQAIKLHDKPLSSYVRLSFLYSTCPEPGFRNGKEAVALAQKSSDLTEHKNNVCEAVLAAAHAECGDFNKAIEYQKKAIELADDKAKAEYEKRLAAYKANKPWRQ
jgi:tetratricopeptide (TPR) repeat protein